ncbi:hypothetical protein [Streptomyces noursei]|uniref:Uncharacterized protein n=1 Tax=Streptomyces noursei TaxID=1971 RepID=A0A2N8PQY8_STRNR|nr:hypothetical protein [Streptomyces noursei]PNE43381.1 hypothetical protein AOB60_00075 [Streptomyces noursei]
MTKIPELGMDDSLPGAQWARAAQREMNMVHRGGEGRHEFARLPSCEGFAGMCVCGFETPEPSYNSMRPLLKAIREHLERDVFPPVDEAALMKEVESFKLGDLIGYHRLVETSQEHGARHMGWLVAGERGAVRIGPDGFGWFQGAWITFKTEQQEG